MLHYFKKKYLFFMGAKFYFIIPVQIKNKILWVKLPPTHLHRSATASHELDNGWKAEKKKKKREEKRD